MSTMDPLPRVLVVAPLYHSQRGGLGKQAMSLTERLADKGLQVSVATRRMKGLPPIKWHPRVKIHRLRNPRPRLHNYDQANLQNLIISLTFSINLLRLLWGERKRYDLVHFYGASLPLLLSMPLILALKKTCVAQPAGTDQGVEAGDLHDHYFPIGMLLAWLLTKVTAYIALTPQIANNLLREGSPKERIHHIPNPVDFNAFKPLIAAEKEQLRKELDLEDRRVVISIGRLVKLKGLDVLLRAFKPVVMRTPKALLLIVGDGPERGHLEKLTASLGLQDHVRFLGFREDIPRLLGAADLFCLPSFKEGMPASLIEAQGAGLPAVASDLGGCRAILTVESGILVPPGDAESLSNVLTTLLIDRLQRKLMGEAAQHYVMARFNIERVLGRYLQLYQHVQNGVPMPDDTGSRAWEGSKGCAHD
jgi:glycosyltransferase involved in cell wall biosynthesis